METATNAREFHVARRHQRRIDRRGQHRLPSEVKVWCLDLGDDFRCRLSGDNLGRAVIADVRSWKLVDIPQTFLAIEGTPREREDRIPLGPDRGEPEGEGLAEPYPSARRSQSSAVRAPEVGEHDALEGARPCRARIRPAAELDGRQDC